MFDRAPLVAFAITLTVPDTAEEREALLDLHAPRLDDELELRGKMSREVAVLRERLLQRHVGERERSDERNGERPALVVFASGERLDLVLFAVAFVHAHQPAAHGVAGERIE
jgi:hypothetical protein